MQHYALVLGGTKGLGLSLAKESLKHGIAPVVAGRSVSNKEVLDDFPPGTPFLEIDLNKELQPDLFDEIWRLGEIKYLFWVSGIFERKSLLEMRDVDVDAMINVHLRGPVDFLRKFLKNQKAPLHLVTIASTSSWRIRENETLYCALKAAKAALTRNLVSEIVKKLPGSKVTLVNPGGIKTPNFWKDTKQDISGFMEPDVLANLIWDQVRKQNKAFKELQIFRGEKGAPVLKIGPMRPELPKF